MTKNKVVIIGAGKIGRGYIADLFNVAGYPLVFIDYSKELTEKLRAQGYYTIFKYFPDATYHKEIIKDFDAYCTQTEAPLCSKAIADATYVSINVFPGAVDSISQLIAEAIKIRISENRVEPLNLMIGVNFLFSSKLFKEAILKYLSGENEITYLEDNVALIECLVHRTGAIPTAEMIAEDPLCCNSSNIDFLTVDDIFKGPMPEGVNLHPKKNVPLWMIFKIWVANMSHASKAFYGSIKGYTYMGECNDDEEVARPACLVRSEGLFAMHAEYGLSYEEMNDFDPVKMTREDYLNHELNKIDKDTIARVVADVIRKLGKHDRLVGPAVACMKHGRTPYFLAKAIACAYHYYNENDKTTIEVQNYVKENGIRKAMEKYSELSDEVSYEKQLKDLVEGLYYDFAKGVYPFDIEY